MSRTKRQLEAVADEKELTTNGQWFAPESEHPLRLYKAISDFQQDVPILIQNTKGYNYTYVDLSEIVRVITPLLHKHGLAYIQPLVGENEIETILFHVESGESIKAKIKIPIVELDRMNLYQSMGSAISYFRRYSISSLLNLISEKDMDASGKQKEIKKTINDNEFSMALDYIKRGDYTIDKLISKYDLTSAQKNVLKKMEA